VKQQTGHAIPGHRIRQGFFAPAFGHLIVAAKLADVISGISSG